MPIVQFSTPLTLFLIVSLWLLLQVGSGYLVNFVPLSMIHPENGLFKSRLFEREGALYERVFQISRWKGKVPDGASVFQKGFRKKHLTQRTPEYYDTFVKETCRAELVHWIQLFCFPLFALFTDGWVFALIIVYAVAINLPFIMIQRYNRPRLLRLAKRQHAKRVTK
ncbi:MAG: hypothetical protein ACRDBX_00520 [Erysipelotrichaceae bacterium]